MHNDLGRHFVALVGELSDTTDAMISNHNGMRYSTVWFVREINGKFTPMLDAYSHAPCWTHAVQGMLDAY